jgi:hypothetical protein
LKQSLPLAYRLDESALLLRNVVSVGLIFKHIEKLVRQTYFLVIGREPEGGDERNSNLDKEREGNWLVVEGAQAVDAGDYTCHISAFHPKEVVHSVLIRTRSLL